MIAEYCFSKFTVKRACRQVCVAIGTLRGDTTKKVWGPLGYTGYSWGDLC